MVTLDKPFLFSNISGVLSYFGMDIHRGQAMTTPNGLVLDVFEFSDDEKFLAQNPAGAAEIHRILQTVVAGVVDVTTLLRGKTRSVIYRRRPRFAPTVRFDNEHSQKYTVLEIVADDAVGLLHRDRADHLASRMRSRPRADFDGREEGDRRAARQQAREQAVGGGSGRARAGPGRHAGGME